MYNVIYIVYRDVSIQVDSGLDRRKNTLKIFRYRGHTIEVLLKEYLDQVLVNCNLMEITKIPRIEGRTSYYCLHMIIAYLTFGWIITFVYSSIRLSYASGPLIKTNLMTDNNPRVCASSNN